MAKRPSDANEEGVAQKKARGVSSANMTPVSSAGDNGSVSVWYYGTTGAFSEEAAREFFKGSKYGQHVQFFPSEGIDKLFSSVVESGSSTQSYAVVPFENSVSGTLQNVLIKLVTTSGLHIIGEVVLAEEHCLCVKPGSSRGGIRNILSHPHLLTQSNKFLQSLAAENGEPLTRTCTFDSATACSLVDDESKAAIASRRAAQAYGLEVLDSKFADVESETRYLVLSSSPAQSANRLGRRCTVSFVLANQQGAMFKCLSCFAFRNLNVLKISTVPLGGKKDDLVGSGTSFELGHWDYVFVLDFIASPNQDVNTAALQNLREYAARVRVLGEYAPAMSYVSPSKRDISQLLAFA